MSSASYSELKQRVSAVGEGALPAANIIISGVAGSGKSTLINAIFGEELAKTGIGKPVTDYIEKYEKENAPVRIWDTVGFELKQSVTKNVISDIKQLISDKSQNKQDLLTEFTQYGIVFNLPEQNFSRWKYNLLRSFMG